MNVDMSNLLARLWNSKKFDYDPETQADYEFAIQEYDRSRLSAYDEVLMFLDMMMCWFDHDFGSGISFSSVFDKLDIENMYHQLKQMESLLIPVERWSNSSLKEKITALTFEARDYVVSKVENILRLKIEEQATSSTDQSNSYHVLEMIVKISNKEEHCIVHDVVASLLHDLDRILSFHKYTCDSEQQFRIGDIQIMYDNLSMMDFLLSRCSQQGYGKTLIKGLEHWVHLVAYVGRDYIDLWPQSLIEKQSTGSFSPPFKDKFDYQLHKLTQRMEYINRELIGLTGKQPTGSFPSSSEHIVELQGTISSDGVAQVSCQNLHRITTSIKFVNNRLKWILNDDTIRTTWDSKKSDCVLRAQAHYEFAIQEYDSRTYLSVYNEVLMFLLMMLCWFDHGFGSGISFSSVFKKLDIANMYHQLKQMESLLNYSPDEHLSSSSLKEKITALAFEARYYVVSKVENLLRLKIDEQATSSTDQSNCYHVLEMIVKISNKEEHFVLYDAVASLLHDLELILGSHKYTCDSEVQFRMGDIQIMYDNLSMMNSLLFDSSGQVYDKTLINDLEHWVDFVTYVGRDYIDLWPQSLIEKQSTGSFPPPFKRKFDYQLHKLTQRMESINRKLIGLTVKQPTGSFPSSSEHIFELQGTISADGATQVSCQYLHQITKSIEFVNNRLKKIRDDRDIIQTSTQSSQGTTSTDQVFIKLNKLSRMSNKEGKLVGFEDDLLEMLNRLTGYPPKLQVLAVVGMGGIGKTTFTESLYDHPFVRYHFDIHAWFTISLQYHVKEVLIGLLHCLTGSTTGIYERSNEELKQTLYQSLKGMKYLIVLDDMWDKQVWNDLKRIFPNDENGSRIILTTRLKEVAEFASPDIQPHFLPCLNPDQSWELLCSKMQINGFCPPELEPIGKRIACKCQGLPLAIVVVAGLLSKRNLTLDVWEEIAKSVCSFVMKGQKQLQNILALSYNNLPDHLKPCFLYMGIFPEDSKIPAKKLIWIWIGEGFIRPRKLKSLEEVAEEYLEDLIGRSLVRVNRRTHDGSFMTCFLHDMLRDFCLRESHKQQFVLVFHKESKYMTEKEKEKFMSKCRRTCFHSNTLDTTTISWLRNTRSFLWFKTITSIDLKSYSFMNLKRLKVLDIIDEQLEELPRDIIQMLANCRYLALSFRNSIDKSIFSSIFHNIQILIVEGEWNGQLPKEFWTMSELRHFYLQRCFSSYWPEESRPNIVQLALASKSPKDLIYPVHSEELSIKVLQNLQSLVKIRPISCTEAVFLSMPNLKMLGVFEDEEDCGFRGWLTNLVHLKELQTLKYVFRDPFTWLKPERLPSQNFILSKLINLTISGTAFPWEDILKLCALPKLEVLKLKNYAFIGPTWTLEPDAGGFPCLKYLLIRATNIQSWEADDTHFPKLQHLVLMKCRLLKAIPYGIFEAPLLERIELHNCSETTVNSAEQLQQELLDNGNDSLVLHISPDRRQR